MYNMNTLLLKEAQRNILFPPTLPTRARVTFITLSFLSAVLEVVQRRILQHVVHTRVEMLATWRKHQQKYFILGVDFFNKQRHIHVGKCASLIRNALSY